MAARWCLLVQMVAAAAATAIQPFCELQGPIDLGRTVSVNSIPVTQPFTPGNLTEITNGPNTFRINDFCIGEHTGTHLDSPFHFNRSTWTVSQIPLERLLANGVFLNVTEAAAENATFRLEPEHVDQWVAHNGALPDNALLLISYGWAQLYGNRSRYLGTSPDNFANFHAFKYPGMSVATAQKLADMEQIVGIGVDTPSIDPSGTGDAHTILAAKNVYNLENVDLDQPCLPARGFKVHSLPMKLSEGTGAPVRIIALPDYHYHHGNH